MKKLIPLSSTLLIFGSVAQGAELQIEKENSRIQVDAKATGHGFTGDLKDYTVKVAGNASTSDPSSVALKWDFNDLKTGDEKRDKEMIKWLGGGTPTGTFTFGKSWKDDTGNLHAEGEITIHGISKTISFPYRVTREGNWVTIDGTAKLDYQNFKLPIIRNMAVMTVDPKLTIRFHLTGQVK